jgi:hypothetical protein
MGVVFFLFFLETVETVVIAVFGQKDRELRDFHELATCNQIGKEAF